MTLVAPLAMPHPQVAALLTSVVTASGAAFLFHCSIQDNYTASLHPPALYLGLLALILNPTNLLFKVSGWGIAGAWGLGGRRACAWGVAGLCTLTNIGTSRCLARAQPRIMRS